MGKPPCVTVSEPSLRSSDNLSPEAKTIIRRALKWLPPEYRCLHTCVQGNLKHFYAHPYDTCPKNSLECVSCTGSTEIDIFCNERRSPPVPTAEELCFALEIAEEAIYRQIIRHIGRDPRKKECKAEFFIVPVILPGSESDSTCSTWYTSSTSTFCRCGKVEEKDPRTCQEFRNIEHICFDRPEELFYRHFGWLLYIPSTDTIGPGFNLDYVGPSEEIAKWGDVLELVDRILSKRDFKLTCYDSEGCLLAGHNATELPVKIEPPHECCAQYNFDNLDRFRNIEFFGFSLLCRSLARWSHCITKRWNCVTRRPHVIIHLPSMSHPVNLRRKTQHNFKCVQSIQIGRIGWLVNEKARVIYVYPGESSYETECFIKTLVDLARPDISHSRLQLLMKDDAECFCRHIEDEFQSGCEKLFYTPNLYKRLRNLSAGCQGFIIPGILCKTDVFVGCELKTPILGSCLTSQHRLLDKHYVMSLLAHSDIPHPPFAPVHNFKDLCMKMAGMMTIDSKSRWLVKLNRGFCGYQTGLVTFDRVEMDLPEDELAFYLDSILPQRLKIDTRVYKNISDFFEDLEEFGGVVECCPEKDFTMVSLGCFIEHDVAKATLRTSADVIRKANEPGCNCSDLCYIIPQTSLPTEELEQLVEKLGEILILEPFVGFFCVDLAVFYTTVECGCMDKLTYWVVDLDPYYSDLMSFEDWRRFCLNIPICEKFCVNPTSLDCECDPEKSSVNEKNDRFVVCSGKLYIEGLNLYSGNFLVELCEKYKIAYSHQSKTGVMICPINDEKKAFLVFALCRGRRLALKYFVQALKALHYTAIKETNKSKRKISFRSYLIDLAVHIEKTYDLVDKPFQRPDTIENLIKRSLTS